MKSIIPFLGYIPFDFEGASVSERVRIKRLIYGLTQKELAQQVGLDASTIMLIEQGKVKPLQRTLNKLIGFI